MNDATDDNAQRSLARLLAIMRRLRDPSDGCPWDRAQDFASIAPYTIEEAYEVADAIMRAEPRSLEGELGDLLFQVVFHAQMGAERQWFDFASVADSISNKLTERHPHVFAGARIDSTAELNRAWEDHKARERATRAGSTGELADVPLALPALARAAKLGKRAARVGFDWPDARGVRAKMDEELRETEEVCSSADSDSAARLEEELGDLLFAVANWARHLGVDPEEALRLANAKFERRFVVMEHLAGQRSLSLRTLTPEAWDELWNEAKNAG
jgi:nucleoside triphosphate diphosphatase